MLPVQIEPRLLSAFSSNLHIHYKFCNIKQGCGPNFLAGIRQFHHMRLIDALRILSSQQYKWWKGTRSSTVGSGCENNLYSVVLFSKTSS